MIFIIAMKILGSSIVKITRVHKSRYGARPRSIQNFMREIYIAVPIFFKIKIITCFIMNF